MSIYTIDQRKELADFNLSYDILKKIPGNGNLFSYDIGDDIEWLDVESLAYLDRNKDMTEKILSQMSSGSDAFEQSH